MEQADVLSDRDVKRVADAVIDRLAQLLGRTPAASIVQQAARLPAPEVERMTYTRAEACKALGISVTTIWRLEQVGLIKTVPGMRHKLYSAEMLKQFLASRQR